MEMTETQLEELGRLVSEGYTSGRLDEEDGTKISWSLTTEIWKD